MAEYFSARGMPVPRELQRSPLADWRRLLLLAASLLLLYVGLRITDLDFSRANPEYSLGVIRQLFNWDFSILTPQNEFETFWNTAGGLMIVTIFLGFIATVFSIVVALPLSFLGARNVMGGSGDTPLSAGHQPPDPIGIHETPPASEGEGHLLL